MLQALDLSAEAQAALLPALSQPLPRNSHLACRFGGAEAGCGYLDPPCPPRRRPRCCRRCLSRATQQHHLACRFGGAEAGCGYLDPPEDPAPRVRDEGEGAVRLFVARQWIGGEPAAGTLPRASSNAENAFLHQQVLNLTGGRDYQSFSARGTGVSACSSAMPADWYFTQQRYAATVAMRISNSTRLLPP